MKKTITKFLILIISIFPVIFSKPQIAFAGDPPDGWWDNATVELLAPELVTSSTGISAVKIEIKINPDLNWGDKDEEYAFRLSVNGEIVSDNNKIWNQEIDSFGLPTVYEWNDESAPLSEWRFAKNAHRAIQVGEDNFSGKYVISVEMTPGAENDLNLYDFNINDITSARSYQLQIFGMKNRPGIGSYWIGVKNLSNTVVYAEDDTKETKLRYINETYSDWRDMVAGRCGDRTLKIDPFLDVKDCNGDTNIYWTTNTLWDVITRGFLNTKKDFSKVIIYDDGSPPDPSDALYLTEAGEQRWKEIQAKANVMAGTIHLLDAMNITDQDLETTHVIKRHWDYHQDDGSMYFTHWAGEDGLKTTILWLVDYMASEIEDTDGPIDATNPCSDGFMQAALGGKIHLYVICMAANTLNGLASWLMEKGINWIKASIGL